MGAGARLATSRPAAVGFGLFCALLGVGVLKGALVAPSAASASAPVVETTRPADGRRDRAAAVVAVANGHVALWRLQHGGRLPDFVAYPDWQQFLQSTDRAGWPSGAARAGGEFPIGPYLARQPVNPLNELSNVVAMRGTVRPGDAVPDGRRAGFVIALPDGAVFATDETGLRVLDGATH